MITEALVRLLTGLTNGILNLFPQADPPQWFTSAGAQWTGLMNQVAGLSYWLPVSLAVQVTGAILGCIVVGFIIKCIRIVLSFFTAGGGSAA